LSLSGASFCGTCFMQTSIFKDKLLPCQAHGMGAKRLSINESRESP